jgi:predicted dehydrogenase
MKKICWGVLGTAKIGREKVIPAMQQRAYGDVAAIAGGGGLMDIGCYCISLAQHIFGFEPRRVLGLMQYDPVFTTDRYASGVLDFGEGVATFSCGTQMAP